jgi:hypothetical protein
VINAGYFGDAVARKLTLGDSLLAGWVRAELARMKLEVWN